MPSVIEVPEWVKPYRFHGVDLDWHRGNGQAVGTCPLCGKPDKFFVSLETGKWDCKVCATSGNLTDWLRLIHEQSAESTSVDQVGELAADRGLLDTATLTAWGAVRSSLTDEWLVPGYGMRGGIVQLYRYSGGKLLATSTVGHALYGVNLYNESCNTVYICEGPWDGMALYETMARAKAIEGDSGYAVTGNRGVSALVGVSILAVPGCGVWRDEWARLLAGKRVIFMYDSDHPITNQRTGQVQPPSGYSGVRKVVQLLAASAETRPESVHWLCWGPTGYDHTLPSGYDVRDHLTSHTSWHDRVQALGTLLARVEPIPADWVGGRTAGVIQTGGLDPEPLPCSSYKELRNAWRKAMRWGRGLDSALAVMMAACASVRIVGDQLWVKIISPPSGGKSSLCEALAVARRYVVSKSVIRGFHSGFQTDPAGGEDNSLLSLLMDKTLVTKDGDTLLQSPNLNQILAEARDVYDRVSRTHYRNKMSKDYKGINMTWILCGTSSLRALDSSELGERFLDCVIMDGVDAEYELDVNTRKLSQLREVMANNPSVNGHGADNESMDIAKRLTGGYVEYLRENTPDLLRGVVMSADAASAINSYGTFVAYMRARPSPKQHEEVQRELSTRLVCQLARLGYCLAVVLNKTSLDEEVLGLVRQVALDTARGRVMRLCKWLHQAGLTGVDCKSLAVWVGEDKEKVSPMLTFLYKIGVADHFKPQSNVIGGGRRWRLTPTLQELWSNVVTAN